MGEVSMQKHGMMERDAAERALLEKWLDSAKSAEASIDEARALSQSMGDLQSELAGVQAQAAAAESRPGNMRTKESACSPVASLAAWSNEPTCFAHATISDGT